jgi:hypothetical protein
VFIIVGLAPVIYVTITGETIYFVFEAVGPVVGIFVLIFLILFLCTSWELCFNSGVISRFRIQTHMESINEKYSKYFTLEYSSFSRFSKEKNPQNKEKYAALGVIYYRIRHKLIFKINKDFL